MREIKFRCYDERHKEMRYSDIDNEEFHVSKKGVVYVYVIPKSEGYIGETQYYENYNCQQFTGLKDCNGVDIYEGDIIEWDGIRSFVVYSIDGFSFNGYMKGADKLRVAVYSDIGYGNGVVIGNIHENMELLEK